MPFILCSCAAIKPSEHAYHPEDSSALVLVSAEAGRYQVSAPIAGGPEDLDHVLKTAGKTSDRQTAVVILNNYSELAPGDEFRDRATSLFIGLRGLGYRNIHFLRGTGGARPEGLPTLFTYR